MEWINVHYRRTHILQVITSSLKEVLPVLFSLFANINYICIFAFHNISFCQIVNISYNLNNKNIKWYSLLCTIHWSFEEILKLFSYGSWLLSIILYSQDCIYYHNFFRTLNKVFAFFFLYVHRDLFKLLISRIKIMAVVGYKNMAINS